MKELVFADPYEDEIENSASEDDVDDEGVGGDAACAGGPHASASADTDTKHIWRPGVDTLGDGEALDYDPSAYIMLHQMAVEWPCLSFDVVPDRSAQFCCEVRGTG
jgi:ribosome assembly protein RRB1